jgi:hypothetical protein
MTVDDLISRVVRDLKPVEPLSLPGVRAWRWGVLAVTGGALVVGIIGVRADLARMATTLTFQGHAVLVLLATIMAAVAALVLAVPGERLSPWRLWAPLVAVVAWGVWLTVELRLATLASAGAWTIDFGWGCVVKALLFEALPGAALCTMIGRAAALDVRRAMVFEGLATAGIGALGVQIVCRKRASLLLLVWHAGPVVALTAIAALAGAPLFAAWSYSRGQRGHLS